LQAELATFISDREADGRPLPDYVLDEFEAYLKCGILAHGFLRLKCQDCEDEKIVAFSCKKRGFCPSCCAKRKVEAAAHLLENVLPVVPYRQFVVTFPIPLRYWLQSNRKLYARVHKLMIREIHRYYINKAKALGIKDPRPGSVSFTQRFGSALNLNIHAHVLCLDGVYSQVRDEVKFKNLDAISNGEVANLIDRIAKAVLRYLKKHEYLDKDGEITQNPEVDPLFADQSSLALATQNSILGRIAFGPNAGSRVTKIGSGFGYLEEIPLAKGKLCYSVGGFSLHANTTTNTLQRKKLGGLIEYIARGPLANDRLEILADKKVKLRLKTPYTDGTTHILLSFSEFIEKLVALIPPPKTHLVRWSGVLAPNSPLRKQITLRPAKKKGFQFHEGEADAEAPKKRIYKNHTCVSAEPAREKKMLARVFKIDVTTCEQCGGKMEKVCAVTDGDNIRRYLKHLGLDPDPPSRSPAKILQPELSFDQNYQGA
jgi:hypothetical protein